MKFYLWEKSFFVQRLLLVFRKNNIWIDLLVEWLQIQRNLIFYFGFNFLSEQSEKKLIFWYVLNWFLFFFRLPMLLVSRISRLPWNFFFIKSNKSDVILMITSLIWVPDKRLWFIRCFQALPIVVNSSITIYALFKDTSNIFCNIFQSFFQRKIQILLETLKYLCQIN